MRKLLLILFLNLSVAKAQQFFAPGATWHFGISTTLNSFFYKNGSIKLEYKSDTVINGVNCKKITESFKGDWSYFVRDTIVLNYRMHFTYENNKVIYLFTGSSFDTIVDFNAAIGAKWLWNNSGISGYRHPLTVVDTGHVFINSQYLKTIKTTHTYENMSNQPTITSTFYERLLTITPTRYQWPSVFPIYNDDLSGHGWVADETTSFRCYEDNSFPMYNPYNIKDCDFVTGINNKIKNNYENLIYPNPTNGILNVEFNPDSNRELNNQTQLSFFNIYGKEVKRIKLIANETQINISELSSGIYFVQLMQDGKIMGTEKIIKE